MNNNKKIEFESEEEKFIRWIKKPKTLLVTYKEALLLSDRISLLMEHDLRNEMSSGKRNIPLRRLSEGAVTTAPIELMMKILMAVHYANLNKEAEVEFIVEELFLLRECCTSGVSKVNEKIGENLLIKIISLIVEDWVPKKYSKIPKIVEDQIKEIFKKKNY